jgi:regulator of protease activity HflC (stomatin/prohibitin superfamily)
MAGRLEALLEFVQRALIEPLGRLGAVPAGAVRAVFVTTRSLRWRLVMAVLLAAFAYSFYAHPPFATARRGEVLVRANLFNGSVSAYTAGTVPVLPGIHQVRRYSTRDQVYRPIESASATGSAPFQSNEGLSIGVDLTVRWSIARHSVRDIFSDPRAQIQQEIAMRLEPKLAAMGLALRGVDMGKVDLPQDYRAGMEKLLAEELETEKVRYTLQLKEAQVKQTQLEAEADKVRRQKAAEAAGEAQVIAARAQEETMQHILPFKQKQIEQRQLEAEAEKVARIRSAEGAAEARRIEAKGEADSRQRLADAEAYRLELVGKANAGQMEREGALLAHYPLLIQKTLADKLSDKVQVIIAPTPAAGRFIGSNLIGAQGPASLGGDTPSPAKAQGESP